MNLRIENQNLRFRINEEELTKLCNGICLRQETQFAKQHLLTVSIQTQQHFDSLQVSFNQQHIQLFVGLDIAKAMQQQKPNKEGFCVAQQLNNKNNLQLTLQVDIKKVRRKKGSTQ